MIVKEGKLDYTVVRLDEWKFFTANSYVTRAGELVMGRGAALEVKEKWPDMPKYFGSVIGRFVEWDYGIIYRRNPNLGAFQVKNHFRDRAQIKLIKYSADLLRNFALKHSTKEIHMNFPGIGYGRLSYDRVYRALDKSGLPDNVILWV